jgi:HEAT repeat protein
MAEKMKEKGSGQIAAARYLGQNARAEDVEALVAGLSAEEWRVRRSCAAGFGRLAGSGAVIPPSVPPMLVKLLGDDILNVAEAARDTLLAAPTKESIDALVEGARLKGDGSKTDMSWRIRTAAVTILGGIGVAGIEKVADKPGVEKCLGVIIAGLGDETLNVVNVSRRALGAVPADVLYPRLFKALDAARGPALRGGILDTMSQRLPPEHEGTAANLALAALEEAGEREDTALLRAGALKLLAASKHAGSAEELIKDIKSDSPAVRNAALEALKRLKVKDEEAATISASLVPVLADQDWRKAVTAARALAYYPSPQAIKPLVEKGLTHATINVQEAATSALIAYGKNPALKEKVEEALLAEAGENKENKKKAWEYGAKVFGALKTKAAVKLLVQMILEVGDEEGAAGDDGYWRTQVNAAAALGAIGEKTKEVKDALTLCEGSPVLQLQNTAKGALKALGFEKEGTENKNR